MRNIIIGLLLLLSFGASAQWQQTGSKVRYVNGLGIPTKDTAAGVSADSSQIVIRPADSSLYVKYKRTWQKVGGGTVSGTTNYVSKFTSSTALGNSQIFDNGTDVGIGTASPGSKVQVLGGLITVGNVNTYALSLGNSSGNDLSFGTDASYGYIQSWASKPLQINNQGNNIILNALSGNVGIGYTAPAAKLSVSGTTLINTNTDNGVDKLQVSGSAIASTLKVNTSGQTTTISNYYNTGGGKNIWIGGGGVSSTSGNDNVSLGNDALLSSTSGYYNTAIGTESLRNLTTGDRNIAIAFQSLYFTTTGTNNVAIGSGAFGQNTTGSQTVAIGSSAGTYINGGSNNQTSTQSVYIGEDTRASANGNTNEVIIGHTAIGQGSNTVTLGNSSITKTFLRGSTMVNTTTDNGVDKLQVQGSISGIGFKQAYVTKTGAYTATNDDYVIDCTSGTFTVTLPASSGRTGRILIIKNSGAGTITVDGNASETIDGATTYSLSVQYATVQIMSDGTNWKIIAKF